MPETAENVAQQFSIARADQDAFALRSQQTRAAAQERGDFNDEIVPVSIPRRRKEPLCCHSDEHPRADHHAKAWPHCRTPFERMAL